MASRRKARVLAFQALYFYDASLIKESAAVNKEDIISFSWIDENKLEKYKQDGTEVFARLLVLGTLENINEIDETIKKHLEHWELERLNKIDLAILRLSTYSLLYQNDIHPLITIDEAIKIISEYGQEISIKFVNGVLDSIRKSAEKS